MCFFNSLSVNSTTLETRYKAEFPGKSSFAAIKKGNAFAAISWPVITSSEPGKIVMQEWGLIPSWTKDTVTAKKLRMQTLNARSETVFEKPSFRSSIKTRRCIVPSTGFFEWQHEGTKKIPWFIKIKNTEIFSMAGIWDEWTDKETGEIFRGFSILTTDANNVMAEIHNTKKRMPVILLPGNETEWLRQNLEKDEIISFCRHVGDDLMDTALIA